MIKNTDKIIKPLNFLSSEELIDIRNRLPNPLPDRLFELFLVDTEGDTYLLLDIVYLSKRATKKQTLFFKNSQSTSTSIYYTLSQIRSAYLKKNKILLSQLIFNITIANVLNTLEKDSTEIDWIKIEENIICYISSCPYIFPLLTPSGHTFEADDIVHYLDKKNKENPITKEPCFSEQLISNKAVEQLVQLFYQHAPLDKKRERIDNLIQAHEHKINNLKEIEKIIADSNNNIEFLKKRLTIKRNFLEITANFLPGKSFRSKMRGVFFSIIPMSFVLDKWRTQHPVFSWDTSATKIDILISDLCSLMNAFLSILPPILWVILLWKSSQLINDEVKNSDNKIKRLNLLSQFFNRESTNSTQFTMEKLTHQIETLQAMLPCTQMPY